MRVRLVEDPVLYRDDVNDEEWAELRRRLGEEERQLDEMFGLVLEAHAEGIAMIDPTGVLADRRFPSTGTLGHTALLAISRLMDDDAHAVQISHETFAALISELVSRAIEALVAGLRRAAGTASTRRRGDAVRDTHLAKATHDSLQLLPAAARFTPVEPVTDDTDADDRQATLW